MSSPAPSAAGPDTGAAPPVGGAARWLRGATVGSVASVVSLGGHVLGAGSAPGLLPLTGLTSVAVLAAVALSGVRWRLTSLLAVLLGAQVGFHIAFAAAHSHAAAGSGHAAHLPAAGGPGVRMLALHLLAALVSAALLRRGEDVCWQLASAVARPARIARLRVPTAVAELLPRLGAGVHHARSVVSELLVDAAPRRGPPAPRAC
jgi:hypothetical protein